MEIIGLQATPNRMEIIEFIHSLFPKMELINWEGNFDKTFIFNGNENYQIENISEDFSGFAIQIESNKSEFMTKITLLRTPETDIQERELYVALKLSKRFNCKAIINAPENLSSHPYSSLILDNDKVYEADDEGTIWGDGIGKEVKIIKEINIEKYNFDSNGNLIKACC